MAFGADTCLYALDILGLVGHLDINNRLEIENRLLIGYVVLYAEEEKKKKERLSCSFILSLNTSPPLPLPISSINFSSLISIFSHY